MMIGKTDCGVVSPEGGRLSYQNIQEQLLHQNQIIQLDPDQTETEANGANVQQLSVDIWQLIPFFCQSTGETET